MIKGYRYIIKGWLIEHDKGNKGNNTGTNHLGIVWVGVALVLGGVSKRQHIRELRGNPIDLLRRALI